MANSTDKKTFYITTPIYYASGNLHIGHTYSTVVCDAIARYKRLRGYDVFYLTGTDEHGQKVEEKALAAGKAPKEFVDELVLGIKDLWKLMDISYDKFIRTTDDYHEKAVQSIFNKLYEKGEIYKAKYKGKYCKPCESFWTESQLVNGCCPDCGRPVSDEEEESYFFRLSKYGPKLKKLLSETDFLQPQSRVNEMINNFIDKGLQDLAVSRSTFKWGIPVTFDDKHVIYVWIDALSNYITALGYGSDDDSLYKKYWPADVHVVGKEIVRFHSIIWPAILMALGEPIPKKVFGHGWIKLGGQKMGKSVGNVVDPYILAGRYGVDAIRYFLLSEMPFGADGDYSNELLLSRINTDLANDFGNLVKRTLAMSRQYFGGKVSSKGEALAIDTEVIEQINSLESIVDADMDGFLVNKALEDIFLLIKRANKYIDENAPWALSKDPARKARLERVIYTLLEIIRVSSLMLLPFFKNGPKKALDCLGVKEPKLFEGQLKYGLVKEYLTSEADAIYPRLDLAKELAELEEISKKVEAEKEKKEDIGEVKEKEEKKEITIDDFVKLDLRVAEVIACEKVAGSDKLLKETLKVGDEIRTVCSGLAEHYAPEELVGKKVILVANLAPRKMRGIVSQGMLLCAEKDGKVVLLSPEKDIESGAICC
ncbi:MAG: methionine--tRNA ligase [Clostridia bacterium]|nr:methionine--tRNA ligase [Clostridia bacterium]